MKWDQRHYNGTNPDEDTKSISSESSAEGADAVDTQHIIHHSPERYEQEIWEKKEIEKSLNELPNAEKLFEILNSNKLGEIPKVHRDVNTALILAVWYQRHTNIVSLLNDYAADPNTTDLKGRTPLHLACSKGDFFVTKILLRHGAKAHQWDDCLKATPLHCAAR